MGIRKNSQIKYVKINVNFIINKGVLTVGSDLYLPGNLQICDSQHEVPAGGFVLRILVLKKKIIDLTQI